MDGTSGIGQSKWLRLPLAICSKELVYLYRFFKNSLKLVFLSASHRAI